VQVSSISYHQLNLIFLQLKLQIVAVFYRIIRHSAAAQTSLPVPVSAGGECINI
jgi:hypothetical protein